MSFDIKKNLPLVISAFVIVLLGVGSAYLISQKMFGGSVSSSSVALGAKTTGNEVGTLDSNVKYDNAMGMLVEGGIANEGTHHLEREGGPSKNVYLTSSVVDLQSYVGKKIEVWGQTLSSKKGGWLMDVAKIKVSND